MTDDRPTPERDVSPPEDAFLLLANETRARILAELGYEWGNDWPGVLAYSELMERVGEEDSGKFNYHLTKLTDKYVTKRSDGYMLTFPGVRMYQSIVAGTLTENAEIDPFTLEDSCLDCDGALGAEYLDNRVKVHCRECNARYFESPLPPRVTRDYSKEELLHVATQRERHRIGQFLEGICPWCASPSSFGIETPATDNIAEKAKTLFDTHIIHQCDSCGDLHGHSIGESVLNHPAVVSFYYDHGYEISAIPTWNLEFAATDHFTEIISQDPWKFLLKIPLGDEELKFRLDDSLHVVKAERTSVIG
jgi:hypothetical protein